MPRVRRTGDRRIRARRRSMDSGRVGQRRTRRATHHPRWVAPTSSADPPDKDRQLVPQAIATMPGKPEAARAHPPARGSLGPDSSGCTRTSAMPGCVRGPGWGRRRCDGFRVRKRNRPGRSRGSDRGGWLAEDSGDDRLSRQRHYHGPGGLNGRVRNGNGWDPASVIAGNSAGGRSGHPAVQIRGSGHKDKSPQRHKKANGVLTNLATVDPSRSHRLIEN